MKFKSRWLTTDFHNSNDVRVNILPYLFTPSIAAVIAFKDTHVQKKKLLFWIYCLILVGAAAWGGEDLSRVRCMHITKYKLPGSFVFSCFCTGNLCSQQEDICRLVTFITRKGPGFSAAVVFGGLF